MIPACPNNLLLMALVFWCAASGATINDSGTDEDSHNNGPSYFDPCDIPLDVPAGPGFVPTRNRESYTQKMIACLEKKMPAPSGPPGESDIQNVNACLNEVMPAPPGPPGRLRGAEDIAVRAQTTSEPPFGAGCRPPLRPGSEDSYHDGSLLPCHKTSDTGGNSQFDDRRINANFPVLESNTEEAGVSEFALQFLAGPITTIIIPSFYTAVCLISVPANICALLVFLRRIKPLNPAVIYMLNLAFADLLFAMVLPFKIFYHFKGNNWIFREAMCRLVTAAFEWNMYCSILLITLISMDRLLSVVYPVTSLSCRSPRKAFIACAAMWVLSFAGSLHTFFTEQTFRVSELDITTCHDIQPSQPFHHYKIYFITLYVFLFFLPLIIIVVSYTRVIITLNKDQPGIPDASGRKRRAAMLTRTVLVMFVLCFTPTHIIQIIHLVMYAEKPVPENQLNPDLLYVVYSIFLCLGSLNCVLDPLVYYFGSTQFQKEVCSMLQYKKTKQGTSSNQTSPGQSNPINATNQTNTKSDCEANSK